MQRLLETARQIAPTDCNVLLNGRAEQARKYLRVISMHVANVQKVLFLLLTAVHLMRSSCQANYLGMKKALLRAVAAKKGLVKWHPEEHFS